VIGEWRRRVLPKHTDLEAKLADMDRTGIARAALSINDPGPELFGADGRAVAELANDFLAEACRSHPDRFFALAVLPLEDMNQALAELDRAAGRLGAKGILLYSNLNGKFPDLPEFRPLFRRAEELGLPILLHPAYPVTYAATQGYEMAAGLGLMFDTTIALCRIILSGLLDEHPRLELVCPHVGGALPYLIGRIDHQTQVLGRGRKLREPPSVTLRRRIHFDTVTPIPLAIRYAYDFAGPDRLLYGSDHPWVDPGLIAGAIESLHLPPADEARIFSGNARRLFRL
jgi:predicted TIM-barrel fold metal-dependent hydrolase